MPINQESLQDQLYDFLKSQGYKPVRYNSAGKTVPLSKLADVFKFDFKMDDDAEIGGGSALSREGRRSARATASSSSLGTE